MINRDNLENNGIKEYGSGARVDSSLLWTSAHTGGIRNPNTEDPNAAAKANASSISAKHVTRQNKQRIFNPYKDGNFNEQIWRNAAANSFFNNSPQKAVEGLLGLKNGDNLLMFDMETLGTFNGNKPDSLKWYTPTEIALVHSRYNSDGSVSVMDGPNSKLSLLVRPTDDAFSHIHGLLGQLKSTRGKVWQKFSADERRTLSDLVLYATKDPNEIFDRANGITRVKGQMRHLMPLQGTVLNDPATIGRMELGLSNLRTFGNDMGTIATQINTMMKEIKQSTKQDIKIGGYNIHAFDIPLFMDYINNGIAKNGHDTHIRDALSELRANMAYASHVDVYAGINSLYTDTLKRFGINKKLEHLGERFGIDKIMAEKYGSKASHFAAYDAESTAHLFNYMLKNEKLQHHMDQIRGGAYSRWNTSGMTVGDKFLAHTGLRGSSENIHDAVYRLGDKGFELAYDIKNGGKSPAIYRNSVYSVFGMYKDMKLSDGKNHYGIMLHNEDDGLYHFLARENISDLQNVLHRSLSYLGDQSPLDKAGHEYMNRDRALRHYGRMYSEDGGVGLIRRTYSALDALQVGRSMGMDTNQLESHVRNAGGWKDGKGKLVSATPEFYRNLTYLEGRLTAERDVVMPFLGRLDADPNFKLKGRKVDREAQGIALRHYRKLLDEHLGENKMPTDVGGIGALSLSIDGKEKYFTLNSMESLKGQLRLAVSDGHIDTPSNYTVKSRLLSLVNQVRAKRGATGRLEMAGISDTELRNMTNAIHQLGDKESYNSIIEYMGNVLYDIHNLHQDQRLRTINIESPTQVAPKRLRNMAMMGQADYTKLMDRAIDGALPFRGFGFDGNKFNILGNSPMAQMFQAHDESIGLMMKKSRVQGTSFGDPISSEKKLSDLAKAFTYNDMEVALLYHGEKKGLVMAIANKADAERIFRLSPNEIIENSKVALVNLPSLNRDGSMTLPGQERIARLKLMSNREGGYHFGTGFDEVVDALKMSANKASSLIKEGKALDARGWLNSTVRKTVQSLSLNNSRGNLDETDMFRSNDLSGAAKWARGGILDVSELAEEWFRGHYADNKGQLRYSKLKSQAGETHQSFTSVMSFNERMEFQRNVREFAARRGLNLDAGSVKDTHVSQYLRATRDIRELTPFGQYNPMARENILKSINYLPLEEQSVRNSLKARGFKDEDVERMITRRFMTTTANQELAGETNYLNLRAAYLNDKQLSDLMKTSKARVSTYDGMFLIADDVADALTTKREKLIRLGNGAVLHKDIAKLFGDSFDFTNQSFTFKQGEMRRLGDLGLTRDPINQKVTVSTLIKNGVERADEFYKDPQNEVFVKGWDHEKRALILEKHESFLDGFKAITDAGDRVTAVRVERQVLRGMGIDADVVLDPMKATRHQFGSEPYKAVNLVLDEALRHTGSMQNGQFTIGQLHGKDVLDEVSRMVSTHFGVSGEALQIDRQTGRLLMDPLFGLQGQKIGLANVHGFLSEADKWFGHEAGKGFADGKIAYGNIGLGVANVYNWQNSIGAVMDDHEGIVRWGVKERDVIQSRLDRLAKTGAFGKGVTRGSQTVTGQWLQDHMMSAARAQEPDIEKYTKGLIDSVRTYKEKNVGEKDIIIRTRGEAFSETDQLGRNTARKVGSNYEISMHALNDLPTKTSLDQTLTVGDYQKTIISMRDLEINQIMESGSLKSHDDGFKKMLEDAGGSVLFEMPDDSFSHSHVRFVDTRLKSIGDTPIVQKLQKSQMQIWRETKRYMGEGTQENRNALQGALDSYHESLAHTLTSSREGSISKRLMSADMDMAGRFTIQSLNPFEAAKNGYEEATAYVSKSRMTEMISGSEDRIASALRMDTKATGGALRNEVLAQIEKNGLYGFVGRYPTINEDTIQVMKLAIDPNMGADSRQALLTAGTASRLKADFDGDFLSTVLTHYKSGSFQLHDEMGSVWKADKTMIESHAANQLASMQKDMENVAKGKGVSVGTLMTHPDYEQFRNDYASDWMTRTSALDSREALEARLGKVYIGTVDNMRKNMNILANRTYDIMEGHLTAGASADEAARVSKEILVKKKTIEEFGRMLAQDLISSKKFDTQQIKASLEPGASDDDVFKVLNQRVEALGMMTEGLQNPDMEGRRLIEASNKYLQNPLQDTMIQLEAGKPHVNISVGDMLDTYQEVARLNGSRKGLLRNPFMRYAQSEGLGIDELADSIYGKGDSMIGSTVLDDLARVDPQGFGKTYSKYTDLHAQEVLDNYRQSKGQAIDFRAMVQDSGAVADPGRQMLGSTVADDAAVRFRDVARQFTSGIGGLGGVGFGAIKGGAAAFGGMWAMSALMRSGPTPEETVRNSAGQVQDVQIKGMMQQPTARVTPNENGEQVNISISAKHAAGMTHDQIASIVHGELNAMMPMTLDMNMNVNDNTQNINKQWLQGLVAQSMSMGRVF